MMKNLTYQLNMAKADVSGFMLLKIDLPNSYERAIVRTKVTAQEILTYNMTRQVKLINQETANIRAKGSANVTIINSNATSFATRILNKGMG